MRHLALLTLLALVTWTDVEAQTGYDRVSVGLSAGRSFNHGDLDNENDGYVVGGRLGVHVTSAFGLYADYGFGRIHGIDEDRGLAFRSEVSQFTAGARFDLFNLLRFSQLGDRVSPFLGIGAGVTRTNILEGDGSTAVPVDDWAFSVTPELGLDIRLTNWLDATVRYQFTVTGRDDFDGHDPDVLANRRNDSWSALTGGFTVHFGRHERHIKWKRDAGLDIDIERIEELEARVDSLTHLIEARPDSTEWPDRIVNRNDPPRPEVISEPTIYADRVPGGPDFRLRAADPDKSQYASRTEPVAQVPSRNRPVEYRMEAVEQPAPRQREIVIGDPSPIGQNAVVSTDASSATDAPKIMDVTASYVGTDANAQYFVIVESFRFEENAREFRDQLLARGYAATLVYDTSAGYTRVSAYHANQLYRVIDRIDDVRRELNADAWVLRNLNY